MLTKNIGLNANEKIITNESKNLQESKQTSSLLNDRSVIISFICASVLASVLLYLKVTEFIYLESSLVRSPMIIPTVLALRNELKRLGSQRQENDDQEIQNIQDCNDTDGKFLQLYTKWSRLAVLCLLFLAQGQSIIDVILTLSNIFWYSYYQITQKPQVIME